MRQMTLIAILAVSMVGVAQADMYTDPWNPTNTKVTTSPSTWITHLHDITDDGFPTTAWEYVTSAKLYVTVKDDSDMRREYASVLYDGTTWNLGEIDGSHTYNTSIITSLAGDGQLSMTVKSTGGDFWFEKSNFKVWTDFREPDPDPDPDPDPVVPVPGAVLLGMLGLSVAGARLRKRSA